MSWFEPICLTGKPKQLRREKVKRRGSTAVCAKHLMRLPSGSFWLFEGRRLRFVDNDGHGLDTGAIQGLPPENEIICVEWQRKGWPGLDFGKVGTVVGFGMDVEGAMFLLRFDLKLGQAVVFRRGTDRFLHGPFALSPHGTYVAGTFDAAGDKQAFGRAPIVPLGDVDLVRFEKWPTDQIQPKTVFLEDDGRTWANVYDAGIAAYWFWPSRDSSVQFPVPTPTDFQVPQPNVRSNHYLTPETKRDGTRRYWQRSHRELFECWTELGLPLPRNSPSLWISTRSNPWRWSSSVGLAADEENIFAISSAQLFLFDREGWVVHERTTMQKGFDVTVTTECRLESFSFSLRNRCLDVVLSGLPADANCLPTELLSTLPDDTVVEVARGFLDWRKKTRPIATSPDE